MQRRGRGPEPSPLVLGLAAAFAGMTALLAIGGVVAGSPVAVVVAVPLGVTAYFMYYHGSGKLARMVYRREAARQYRQARGEFDRRGGGFGAGPRTRDGPRTRAEREARARFGARAGPRGPDGSSRFRDDAGWRGPTPSSGPTRAEARDVLGVGSTADQAEIKRAYRKRVKDVHPDRGGDEDEFKRVTKAYDRLSE